MQLKEALDLYGRAMNQHSAWGYSPYPIAERLANGTIKVTTYHHESEWRERICATPESVDFYLYTKDRVVTASSGGKRFEAHLVLEETGFSLHCTIDEKSVSIEEYKRTLPQDMREWLPSYWDGPGEWDIEGIKVVEPKPKTDQKK